MAKEILLADCKTIALVDDEDYQKISQFTWYLVKVNDLSYAQRIVLLESGKRTHVKMHHDIFGKCSGKVLDHANRNGLDNRKQNLRFATRSQNNANARVKTNSKSQVKGCWFNPKTNLWVSWLAFEGKKIYVGKFKNLEDAKIAFANKHKQVYGEFSRTE